MVAKGARSVSRSKADEQKRVLLKNHPDYIREIYGKNNSKINFINDPAESKSTAELIELAIIEDVINYLYRDIKEENVNQINIGSITEEQFAQGLRDVQGLQKKWRIDYGELLHH